MGEVKWIKITTDIFDDEKMYAIETQQDGQLIELIWFKLLCLAGKCNNHGFLMINNKIAYTDEMLASIFRIEIGSVQRALNLFEQLEMIEVVENAYMIANWDKHQSIAELDKIKEQNRIRQQKHRDKQKQLLLEEKEESNVTNNVTSNVINNVNCSYSISNNINKKDNIPYIDIIDYLNKLTGKNYKSTTKKTKDCIKARWNEGFTLDDFKRVIDIKSKAWGNDPRMEMYLRPETLFGTKFEGYLNEGNKNQKPITSAPKKSVDEIRKEIYGN